MTSRSHRDGMERSVAVKSPRGWPFGAKGPFRTHVSAATSEYPAQVNDALLVEALWERSRRYKSEPVPLRELSQDPLWAQLYGEATSSRDDIYVDMRITKSMLKSHIRQKKARDDTDVSDEALLARLVDETPCPAPKYALPADNADGELDGPSLEPEETYPLQQPEPEDHPDVSGSSVPSHDAISAALQAADVALRQIGEVPCEPTSSGDLASGAAAQRLNHYGAIPLQSAGREPSSKMSPMVSIMGRCEHDPNIWDTEGARTKLYLPPGGQHQKGSGLMQREEDGDRANGGYPEPEQDHPQGNVRPTEKNGSGGKGQGTGGYGHDGGDDGHDDDGVDGGDDDNGKHNGAINGAQGLAPALCIPPAPRRVPGDTSESDDSNDRDHWSPGSSPRSGPSSGTRQKPSTGSMQPVGGPRPSRGEPEHTTREIFPVSPSHDGSGGDFSSPGSSPRRGASASPDRLRDGSFLPSGGDSPSSPRSRSPTGSRYPGRRRRDPQAKQGHTAVDHPHRREASPDRDYRSEDEPTPARARSPRSPPDGAKSVRRPGRQSTDGQPGSSVPQAAAEEEVHDAPADRGDNRQRPRTHPHGHPSTVPKDELDPSDDATGMPRSAYSPGRQGRGADRDDQQNADQPAGQTGSADQDHPGSMPRSFSDHSRRGAALRDPTEPGTSSLPRLAEVAPDLVQPESGQNGGSGNRYLPSRGGQRDPTEPGTSSLPRLAEVAPDVAEPASGQTGDSGHRYPASMGDKRGGPKDGSPEGPGGRGNREDSVSGSPMRARPDGRSPPVLSRLAEVAPEFTDSSTRMPHGDDSEEAAETGGLAQNTTEDKRPAKQRRPGHHYPGSVTDPDNLQGSSSTPPTGSGSLTRAGTFPGMYDDSDPSHDSGRGHRGQSSFDAIEAGHTGHGLVKPRSGPIQNNPETSHRAQHPIAPQHEVGEETKFGTPEPLSDAPQRSLYDPVGSKEHIPKGGSREGPSEAGLIPDIFHPSGSPGRSGGDDGGIPSAADVPSDFEQYLNDVEAMLDHMQDPNALTRAGQLAPGVHGNHPGNPRSGIADELADYPFQYDNPNGQSLPESTPQFTPAGQRYLPPDDRLSGYPASQDPNYRPGDVSQLDGGPPHNESCGYRSNVPIEYGGPESLPGGYPPNQDPNFRPGYVHEPRGGPPHESGGHTSNAPEGSQDEPPRPCSGGYPAVEDPNYQFGGHESNKGQGQRGSEPGLQSGGYPATQDPKFRPGYVHEPGGGPPHESGGNTSIAPEGSQDEPPRPLAGGYPAVEDPNYHSGTGSLPRHGSGIHHGSPYSSSGGHRGVPEFQAGDLPRTEEGVDKRPGIASQAAGIPPQHESGGHESNKGQGQRDSQPGFQSGGYPATQDPNFRPRMKSKQSDAEEDTAQAALSGEGAADLATANVPGDPGKLSDPKPRPSSKYKVTPYTRSDDQPSTAAGLAQDHSDESKPKLSGRGGGFVQGSPDEPQAPYGGEMEGSSASRGAPGHASAPEDALPSAAGQQQDFPVSTSEPELPHKESSVGKHDDGGSRGIASEAPSPSSRYQVTPYEPSDNHRDQGAEQGTHRPSSKYKVTPYNPDLPSYEPNPDRQQSHHAESIIQGHQSPRHGTWENALADTRHNLGQPRFRVPVSPRHSLSSPIWNGPLASPGSPLSRVVLAPSTIPGDIHSPRLPVDENPLFDLHNGSTTDAGSGRSMDGLPSYPVPGSGHPRGSAHPLYHAQHPVGQPEPRVPEAGGSPGSSGSNGIQGKQRRKKGVPVGLVAARIRRERKTPWRRTSSNDSEDESSANQETGSRPPESQTGGRRTLAVTPDTGRSLHQPRHPHMADDVESLDAWSPQQEPNGRNRGHPSTLQAVEEGPEFWHNGGGEVGQGDLGRQTRPYPHPAAAFLEPGANAQQAYHPMHQSANAPQPFQGADAGDSGQVERGGPRVSPTPPQRQSFASQGSGTADEYEPWLPGQEERMEHRPVTGHGGRATDGSSTHQGSPEFSAAEVGRRSLPHGTGTQHGPSLQHPNERPAETSRSGSDPIGLRLENNPLVPRRPGRDGSMASGTAPQGPLSSAGAHRFGEEADTSPPGTTSMEPRGPAHEVPVYPDPQLGSSASTASYDSVLDTVDGDPGDPEAVGGLARSRSETAQHRSPSPSPEQHGEPGIGGRSSTGHDPYEAPGHPHGNTDARIRGDGPQLRSSSPSQPAAPSRPVPGDMYEGHHSPPQDYQPQPSPRRANSFPRQVHSQPDQGLAQPPYNQTPQQSQETDDIRRQRGRDRARRPTRRHAPSPELSSDWDTSDGGHSPTPRRQPQSSRRLADNRRGPEAPRGRPQSQDPVSPSHPHGRASDGDAWSPSDEETQPDYRPMGHMPRRYPGGAQQQHQISSSGEGVSPHRSLDDVWDEVRPRTPAVAPTPHQAPNLAGRSNQMTPGHLSEGLQAPASIASQGQTSRRRRSVSDSDVSGDESSGVDNLPTEHWDHGGRPFRRVHGRTIAPPAAEGRPMPSNRVPQPAGDGPSSSDSDFSDPLARRRVSGSGSGSDSDVSSAPNIPGWSDVPAGNGRLHNNELEASEAETADSISADVVPGREDRPNSESPTASMQQQQQQNRGFSAPAGGNTGSSGPRVDQSPVRPGSFLTDRGLRWSQSASPASSSDSSLSHQDEDAAPGRSRGAPLRQDVNRPTEGSSRQASHPPRPVHDSDGSSLDDSGLALGRRQAPWNRPATSNNAAETPRYSPGQVSVPPVARDRQVAQEAAAAANPHGRLQLVRVMRWPENEDGKGLALLKICFRAWRLLTWVKETDEDRIWATTMLSHQRLALALLYSTRLEPQPELADRLWPRRDAHRLLDTGLDKMRLVVKDSRKAAGSSNAGISHENKAPRPRDARPSPTRAQTLPENAARPARRPHQEIAPQRDSSDASSSSDDVRPVLPRRLSRQGTRQYSPGLAPQRDARRVPTADEGESFIPSGRNRGPREMEQGGYPDTWIELLEQMRAKMALRAKRHAFNIWAGQRRLSQIVGKMHQRAERSTENPEAGPSDRLETQDCSRNGTMMEQYERWASQMLKRTQRSKAARVLRRWQAFASGEAAARRWQRIADEANSRFANQAVSSLPSESPPPEAPGIDERPAGPPQAWDNDRLHALAGIFSGMSDSDVSSLLDGLDPNERQVIEYQLYLLRDQQVRETRRRPTPPAPRPPTTTQAAEPVSFCRRFPA